MQRYWQQVQQSADFLCQRMTRRPSVGLVTGTGLGDSIAGLDVEVAVDYADIPHFPVSTVESHAGRLAAGSLAGHPVMAMQGRFHLYEGYLPQMVAFPVRVMQAAGVHTLLVTNAAGGLNLDFVPGDIMVICDHINLTGENPLVGENHPAWGVRFPDMAEAYDRHLIETARQSAIAEGLALREGVYVGLKGPSLETPAETRFIRQIGADAVGLSTVQEVIAAVHAGMRVLGLSIITNVNNPDRPEPASVGAIIQVAENASHELARLITGIMQRLENHESSR
ncbi:MAG: purine-nucleoside phosphorylase [Thermodesulfobacteriota bacterium]